MSRYIDAEKLKCSIDSETDSIFDWDMTIEELYYNLCKLVDDEPTADVQEARHGKWESTELMYENGCTRCSECKTEKYAAIRSRLIVHFAEQEWTVITMDKTCSNCKHATGFGPLHNKAIYAFCEKRSGVTKDKVLIVNRKNKCYAWEKRSDNDA